MKFLIISLALAAVASAQLEKTYQPYAPGYGQYARILHQSRQYHPDGSYSYGYETENGISASEEGQLVPEGPQQVPVLYVKGRYQYTDSNNRVYAVEYTAGPQGFVPVKSTYLSEARPVVEYNPYHLRPLGFSPRLGDRK